MDFIDQIKTELSAIEDSFIAGEKDESGIDKAESKLGLKLPESFKKYLRSLGNLSIGPVEYYGLTNNYDFENASIPNFVWFTLKSRSKVKLPQSLVVFQNRDNELYFCIDTDKTIDGNENPVVIWNNISKEIEEVLDCNFSDFLLEDIEECIELLIKGDLSSDSKALASRWSALKLTPGLDGTGHRGRILFSGWCVI